MNSELKLEIHIDIIKKSIRQKTVTVRESLEVTFFLFLSPQRPLERWRHPEVTTTPQPVLVS